YFVAGTGNTIHYVAGGLGIPVAQIPNLMNEKVYLELQTAGSIGGGIRGQVVEPHVIVAGADAGSPSRVNVYDASTGAQTASFLAYGTFGGGVRVAAADVNGDGIADIITGAGPGAGPHVKVIDGTKVGQVFSTGQINDSALLKSFFAFDQSFGGGVYVAGGF